jgi:ATP-dependent Lon protease
MSAFEDHVLLPADFSGKVRLFPLPNLVLFPHVMQPLHIFEPRYRELLEDALAGDHLIAMAILAPGWERDYEGRPPLGPVACLGRITTHRRLDDGTYNLLLMGLRRIRLLRELPAERSFRIAEAEVCEDHSPPQEAAARAILQRKLRQAFVRILPMLPDAQEQLDQLLGSDVSLGVLSDLISYMLDIGLPDKEELLAETDVYRRAELLLEHLVAAAADEAVSRVAAGSFPPQFSPN